MLESVGCSIAAGMHGCNPWLPVHIGFSSGGRDGVCDLPRSVALPRLNPEVQSAKAAQVMGSTAATRMTDPKLRGCKVVRGIA